ncbi:hypothetical protein Tco_0619257 [Tanacetum coccineum]
MVGEMYKEAQQAAGGPTSLGVTSEEGAHPQLNSGSNPSVLLDKTKSARDGLKTAHTDLGANKESKADEISLKVKLEDLSDILKDTRSAFFIPDSPPDEPIIISDESEEEEEVEKDKDIEATSHDKEELEQGKAKVKAEVASIKAMPSYPDIHQLTELLVTSLKPKLSKLLASHDFASCLPTELKELPSKITGLSREIKELNKHVSDMEIELWYCAGNGYLRKGQKSKPKRQNRAREQKEREEKVKAKSQKSKSKSQPKSTPTKSKSKAEPKPKKYSMGPPVLI